MGHQCNDFEMELIGTSHKTVSQEEEPVRVITGQRVMWKNDRSQSKIVCKWSKSKTKLHTKLPPNSNINSVIQVALIPSHNGNRQSVWCSRHQLCNKYSKWEFAGSAVSSPTEKRKAHLKAVHWHLHRWVNQGVNWQVCREVSQQDYEVHQDSTIVTCQEHNYENDQIATKAESQR